MTVASKTLTNLSLADALKLVGHRVRVTREGDYDSGEVKVLGARRPREIPNPPENLLLKVEDNHDPSGFIYVAIRTRSVIDVLA